MRAIITTSKTVSAALAAKNCGMKQTRRSRALLPTVARSVPFKETVPRAGFKRPAITRKSVDLPDALGPMSAVNWPGRRGAKLAPFRIGRSP